MTQIPVVGKFHVFYHLELNRHVEFLVLLTLRNFGLKKSQAKGLVFSNPDFIRQKTALAQQGA